MGYGLPVRDSTTFVDGARQYGVDILPGRLALTGRAAVIGNVTAVL